MDILIREARTADLEQLVQIEAECFPAAEAAAREAIAERLHIFVHSFFVAEAEDGKLAGFINGNVTDEKTIADEMFENCSLHDENGAYQSIFGLDVLPEYRNQGLAAKLMSYMIGQARLQGRKGLILTCKEYLIPYYRKFGYESMGISQSVHGRAVWYDMILEF